MVRNFTFYWGK